MVDRTLARLRKVCLALPEAVEVSAWGHPNFRAGRMLTALDERKVKRVARPARKP